jgi:hypothetical protein
MTINYTTNLSLAEPVTGTESGTWGDDVNKGLTDYLDIAIAGTLALTSASFTSNALTLANTTGNNSSNGITTTTAQYYVLKVSSLAANVTITAPSSSKSYIVVNNDPTYTVTIKASGQTGVTVAVSSRALVVFNGTDYAQVGASAGGSNTQVQYNSSGALAGSANFTFNGTTATINTLNLTNALGVAYGGTGLTTVTTGYIPYGNGTSALSTASTFSYSSSGGLTSNGLTLGTNTTLFTVDASFSYYSSGNLVYLNGNTGGGLALRGDGTGTGSSAVYLNGATSATPNTALFYTNTTERLRIGSAGQWGLAGANYGTSGQVLTSNGSGSAPTWQSSSGGATKAQAIAYAMTLGF